MILLMNTAPVSEDETESAAMGRLIVTTIRSFSGNVRKIGLAELYPRSTIEPQVTYETVV